MKVDNDEEGLYVYLQYKDILLLGIGGVFTFMCNLILLIILFIY